MSNTVNPKPNKKAPIESVPTKGAKRKMTPTARVVLIVLLCLVAILPLVFLVVKDMIVNYYLGKINIVTEEEDLVFQTERLSDEEIPDITEEIYHNGELNAEQLPLICDNKNVTNILLLATDNRTSEAGRTDSMILVSVNQETNKIVLCSFLRDIWAKYPKEPASPVAGDYDKLNHAHAYGGPALTMAVLKETFNIDVKYYAKVDFIAFRDMIDTMGGLDMYLTGDEVYAMNDILSWPDDANAVLGTTASDLLQNKGDGVYHLNGKQALAHARNRTIGYDWARTERQRNVLQAMADKAKTLSLSQLDDLLTTVLPMITTNMPKNEIKKFVDKAPFYLAYDRESTRVPLAGTYSEVNYNIIPDLPANCNDLYEKIYGKAPDADTNSDNQ